MKKILSRAAVAGAATITMAAALPSSAFALGAGDGYQVGNTGKSPTASCSVNSVHTGSDGKKYMVTAGHCVDELSKTGDVTAYHDGKEIGHVVGHKVNIAEGADPSEDWALIELNDDVVLDEGVDSRFGETYIGPVLPSSSNKPLNSVGSANAGDVVYRDGATTGRTPGIVAGNSGSGETTVITYAIPGDSGGVLHDGEGTNLGITSRSAVYLPVSVYNDSDVQFSQIEKETGVGLGEEGTSSDTGEESGVVVPVPDNLQPASDAITKAATDAAFAVDDSLVDANELTNGGVDRAYSAIGAK